ncbi:MAG TPA: homoserine dehydrogenase [Dehalococcoidales bacterium]|nr:homoserine dehydrogenase [Dehalococcoidales bacterium]
MERKSIGIGLLGLGVISGQVAKVLRDKAAVLSEYIGCPLEIKKIKVLPQDLTRPLVHELGRDLFTTDDREFFETPGMDILVEAIGGEYPAFDYLRRGLAGGKFVVTANKEVISKHGPELFSLAQEKGVNLRYEASVGGGIPLISPFLFDLVANRINAIYAIINGTTNYILTRMANEGLDFQVALKNAQELGYAEANPRDDIEGIDASYKLAILASLAFQTRVHPSEIHREGISKLSSRDFRYARELGFAIKLLAIAKQGVDGIEARVHPVLISEEALLAKVDGVFNAVMVEGDLVGNVMFYGRGAGPNPTSSAVVADVVAAAQDILFKSGARVRQVTRPRVIKPISEVVTRYYLRMTTPDRAGVITQITKVLGDNNISISAMVQKEADNRTQSAEIVIMTHPSSEAAMQKALSEMAQLPVVREVSNFLRVEDL